MATKSITTTTDLRNLQITIPSLPGSADFAAAIHEQYTGEPLRGPVFVELDFIGKRTLAMNNVMRDTLAACEGALWVDDGVAGAFGRMVQGERDAVALRVYELPPGGVLEAGLPDVEL